MKIFAYAFEGDIHCKACTHKTFGETFTKMSELSHYFLPDDREGNSILALSLNHPSSFNCLWPDFFPMIPEREYDETGGGGAISGAPFDGDALKIHLQHLACGTCHDIIETGI
jgi:hypothetical protein|tara:strand:- start:2388 stop:2726 length:339 start_codon:yes stop_codon:yes gene_type:complete